MSLKPRPRKLALRVTKCRGRSSCLHKQCKEMTMTPRLNPFTASPAAMQPWIELGKTIQTNGLEPLLRELVMTRASQINGCAFCIHHHVTDARKYGETEDRLHLLSAWREVRALFRPRASRAGLDRGSDAGV